MGHGTGILFGMNKIRIGVLMGGPSTEHEVSLQTGENVLEFLDKSKFAAKPLLLSKNFELSSTGKLLKFPQDFKKFDLIFNALHGSFGEDGTIQGILESLGIPYTGSKIAPSFIAMDKWLSYESFIKNKIPTPKTFIPNNGLKFPLIAKPRNGGSSVGVFIAKSRRDLISLKDDYLLQEYIQGEEFTCGVLCIKDKSVALPVVQIRPKKKYSFFDYRAKYEKGESEELVPAPISKILTLKIQKLALKVHASLGCDVYSRTDFIVKNGKPYVLEINTLPGLTSNSLLPKEAMALGLSFRELLTVICESSLKRF